MSGACALCEGTPEKAGASGEIDYLGTLGRVRDRIAAGDLDLLKGDCALDRIEEILRDESRFAVTHVFRCARCRAEWLLGACIRGVPIWRRAEAGEGSSGLG